MLLEVGIALRDGVPDYDPEARGDVARDSRRQDDPAGVEQEYRAANLKALEQRVRRSSATRSTTSRRTRTRRAGSASSPIWTSARCRGTRSSCQHQRACLGRFFFQVPGGITYGQYWLNVKFANSLVRVPFRVLTKEENKLLDKHFDDIKKQVDAAFKPKPTAPAGR